MVEMKNFKFNIDKLFWTYGLVNDGKKTFIAEIYFEELKTKNKYLFYYKPILIEIIKDIRKIIKDIFHQRKVMKYFKWDGENLLVVK